MVFHMAYVLLLARVIGNASVKGACRVAAWAAGPGMGGMPFFFNGKFGRENDDQLADLELGSQDLRPIETFGSFFRFANFKIVSK